MPETRIFVILAGRNITIQPTRRSFKQGTGVQNLRWLAQGNGVTVSEVSFAKSPTAPISNLQEDPDRAGEWIGDWNTTSADTWQYAIQVADNGTDVGPPVDPELENDPSTGEEEGGG